MPSQVLAILIRIRLRSTPACLYMPISLWALAMVPSVSKLSRASTSVETRPGMILRISRPKLTNRPSMNASVCASWSPPCSLAS